MIVHFSSISSSSLNTINLSQLHESYVSNQSDQAQSMFKYKCQEIYSRWSTQRDEQKMIEVDNLPASNKIADNK